MIVSTAVNIYICAFAHIIFDSQRWKFIAVCIIQMNCVCIHRTNENVNSLPMLLKFLLQRTKLIQNADPNDCKYYWKISRWKMCISPISAPVFCVFFLPKKVGLVLNSLKSLRSVGLIKLNWFSNEMFTEYNHVVLYSRRVPMVCVEFWCVIMVVKFVYTTALLA